jgi:hypothetical protein
MPNLESGFIETNAEGYLQIKEGYPWQIVQAPGEYFPDGSILWRIFRGWNERRLLSGLPLYWYGKKPGAGGTDTTFTAIANPLFGDGPEYTIDDATIYPGANLQVASFWRTIEGDKFFPLVQENENRTNYVCSVGKVNGFQVIDAFAESVNSDISIDQAYEVGIQPTAEGNILGATKINAILRRLHAYRDAHVRFGALNLFQVNTQVPPNTDIYFGVRGPFLQGSVNQPSASPIIQLFYSPGKYNSPSCSLWTGYDYLQSSYRVATSLIYNDTRLLFSNPDNYFAFPILNYTAQLSSSFGGSLNTLEIFGEDVFSWAAAAQFVEFDDPDGCGRIWAYSVALPGIVTKPQFADLPLGSE